MRFYASVLQVGDLVESVRSEDIPPAMGRIVAIRRDRAGDSNLDEYMIQVSPNLIGVFRASQLVYVESGVTGETVEQPVLSLI
jgi:hypothetical protein